MGCERDGKRVTGYGAPGKGNTVLNHCDIWFDLMESPLTATRHRHGMFLPGTHIPICPVERLAGNGMTMWFIMPGNLRGRNHWAAAIPAEFGRSVVVRGNQR